jgi:hypothetical protein
MEVIDTLYLSLMIFLLGVLCGATLQAVGSCRALDKLEKERAA